MASCKGCGASIRWLENVNSGNKNPIDVQPNPAGNIELMGDDAYRVMTKAEQEPNLFDDGKPRFTSHFATCPNAGHFKSCRKCHHTPCVCAA